MTQLFAEFFGCFKLNFDSLIEFSGPTLCETA